MIRLILLLLLSVMLPGSSFGATGKQWLLAVGIIDFVDTRIPRLKYCVKDAESLADHFSKSSNGTMAVTLLKNEQATKDGVLSSLARIKAAISPEDTVIFYYSSHGIGDNEGNTYFVTFDTNKDDLVNTALPMQEIKKVAATLGAKDIVMLFDTCHSGGAKSLQQQNERSYNNLMLAANKQTRLAILTSSRTHEYSVESPEWGHGVFTYFLLEGVKGKADNYPTDGEISVTELFDYVMIAVPRATDRAQHPTSKFSYNWPGSKMAPVHVGKALNATDGNDKDVTIQQNNDSQKGKTTAVEESEQWNNVLEPKAQ